MKYTSSDISDIFLSLRNKMKDVQGHTSPSGFNSAGIVPIWISVSWYYGEDGRASGNACEDPWGAGGPILDEDC